LIFGLCKLNITNHIKDIDKLNVEAIRGDTEDAPTFNYLLYLFDMDD